MGAVDLPQNNRAVSSGGQGPERRRGAGANPARLRAAGEQEEGGTPARRPSAAGSPPAFGMLAPS
jgi:hypothetical protein